MLLIADWLQDTRITKLTTLFLYFFLSFFFLLFLKFTLPFPLIDFLTLQTIPMLLGADIPSDHIPSKACQYVLACFNDKELCNKVVSSTNGETFPQGSLLQLLSFNDWVKVLATLDKNKEAGLAALSELMAQLPNLSKNHNAKLAAFASSGAELSNFLKKLCGLSPAFASAPSTPVIPSSGSIFNRNPAALEAVKDFQINMCSLNDSSLLEMVPKVSKVYPFLPIRQIEGESAGINHQLWTLLNKSFLAPIQN